MITSPKHIVISRTDSIGDVVLTLPLAGILKRHFPDAKISFLGSTYTKSVIECCEHIDEVWQWAELEQLTPQQQVAFLKSKTIDVFIHVFPRKEIAKLAKKAAVEHRIGTSHRLFHLFTCNHRPSFTRKNSDLHESQLNTKLLAPLGIHQLLSLPELSDFTGFTKVPDLTENFNKILRFDKVNLVLHPKSQGSAREWEIKNFIDLASQLDPAKYEIFFTGTEKEGVLFRKWIPFADNIHDLTGKMLLSDLIAFISSSDALIAASTGPLHLAGTLNKTAIGLFSTQRPTHAGRWQPLGKQTIIVEEKKKLNPAQPLNIPLRDVIQALETVAPKRR